MLCVYISEDQSKTHSLLVAVKNVTWYEFRPRFEREERERGEEDLMAKAALFFFLELISFSFLFFFFSRRKISSSLKFERTKLRSSSFHTHANTILSLKIKV